MRQHQELAPPTVVDETLPVAETTPMWKKRAVKVASILSLSSLTLTGCATSVKGVPQEPGSAKPTPVDTRPSTASPDNMTPLPNVSTSPTETGTPGKIDIHTATPEQLKAMTPDQLAEALGIPAELRGEALAKLTPEKFGERFKFSPKKVTEKNFAEEFAKRENAWRLYSGAHHKTYGNEPDGGITAWEARMDQVWEKLYNMTPLDSDPSYKKFLKEAGSIYYATAIYNDSKRHGVPVGDVPPANFVLMSPDKAKIENIAFGTETTTNWIISVPATQVNQTPDVMQSTEPNEPAYKDVYSKGTIVLEGVQVATDPDTRFGARVTGTVPVFMPTQEVG